MKLRFFNELPIYNIWKDEYKITLYFGEEVCPKCKGSGISGMRKHLIRSNSPSSCKLCFGQGKVDWVKRIRGE